jgi:hypothetical protein
LIAGDEAVVHRFDSTAWAGCTELGCYQIDNGGAFVGPATRVLDAPEAITQFFL